MKKGIALVLLAVMLLSLSACGEEKAAEPVNLEELYQSFSARLPEMILLDEGTMLNFTGIQSQDCAQYVVAICAEGLRADEVWLIEAKDADALSRIQKLADTRIQAKLEETEFYVPDQYPVVQKAEVLTKGMYLALLISPDVDALKEEVEKALS